MECPGSDNSAHAVWIDPCVYKSEPPPDPVEWTEPLKGQWTDVLKFVDVNKHAIHGTWTFNPQGLTAIPQEGARTIVPVILPGSYDVKAEFTRRKGNDAIFFVLPVEKRQCMVLFSGWEGRHSGILRIQGKNLPEGSPATVSPGTLINSRRYMCEIRVRVADPKASILVYLDDVPYVRWEGLISDLATDPWVIPNSNILGLGCYQSSLEFHKLELRHASGGPAPFTPDQIAGYQVPKDIPTILRSRAVQWRGNWYWFSSHPMKFPDAQSLAHSAGGRLLLISSTEENEFIRSKLPGPTFLGLVLSSRGTRLTDRLEEHKFFNWDEGQPSRFEHEDLTVIHPSGKWHDHYHGDDCHVCIEWGPETVNPPKP